MPHLNGTGPEGKGPKSGRKLGQCQKTVTENGETGELGKGMGKRRRSQDKGTEGKGLRIKSFLFNEKKSRS
jgi:hypothetical protein